MKKNAILTLILGGLAAVVYFASMAHYAFPGDSAHLQAIWRGLDVASEVQYPLMAIFAKMLGGGNLIAPVCGVIAVVLLFNLVALFIRNRIHGEATAAQAEVLGRIAGVVAALVFMVTPAVREAASHLDPHLFDAVWAMFLFALMIPYAHTKSGIGFLYPIVIGALAALGFCDSAVFAALAPLLLIGIGTAEAERRSGSEHAKSKPFVAITLFAAAFLVTFFIALGVFGMDLTGFLKSTAKELNGYYSVKGWIFIAGFATLPFVVSIFSSARAFNDKPGLVQYLFHIAMSIVVILAIATPLAPSGVMGNTATLPVLTSAFAAVVAGYLCAFWWLYRRNPIGIAAGVVLTFVLAFASVWSFCTFDGNRGAFADKVAKKIVEDLGTRKWFVTDGSLDDHLRIVAADMGRELNIVALSRDLDETYLAALGDVVKAKGIGGSANESLALSLSLGVLPFVQDWFSTDPSVDKEVAIFGAPDLWYSAGFKPVPEFLFFGADASKTADTKAWAEFSEILDAPKGWGSYRTIADADPVTKLKLSLRRHIGLVTNNRGVYLQDHNKPDEAFDAYESVLGDIDADNVCALFNEIEMTGDKQKYPRALAKKRELERKLKAIVDDKERRYIIWRLGYYYGYIRNPDMFVKLGFAWARSGRAGDALAQIRRAIDFVPTEKQGALLNMMAALYASENDQKKSRKIYEDILASNDRDHDALIGLMRLELLNGDQAKALEFLERAVKSSPAEGKRAKIELSMVSMMKNDLKGAREMLKKLTESDPKDLQSWSFLAAVMMQQYDTIKDEKERAAIIKDISERILPEMEKHTTNPYDYYVQTTKAFLLLRQGEEKRREARDAFALAAKARPDSAAAQDLVLGLDISLDDRASAERHAREVLRKNRNAPLANYVMGSLAIRRADYRAAEAFLMKAANAPQPNLLAFNDLAEVLRRQKKFSDAELYARKAVEKSPKFYIAWETLGCILMDQERDLEEAEKCIQKSIELSKAGEKKIEDVRLYTSLARVQVMRGNMKDARMSIRRVQAKIKDLNDFERREFEEIKERVR